MKKKKDCSRVERIKQVSREKQKQRTCGSRIIQVPNSFFSVPFLDSFETQIKFVSLGSMRYFSLLKATSQCLSLYSLSVSLSLPFSVSLSQLKGILFLVNQWSQKKTGMKMRQSFHYLIFTLDRMKSLPFSAL